MKRILYILTFLAATSSYGQTSYLPSDSIHAAALLEKAQALTDKAKYDSARTLCQQALRFSASKHFRRGEGLAYTQLADISYQEGAYPLMKEYDSLAMAIGHTLRDTGLLATAYELSGLYEMDKGSKSRSRYYFNEALRILYEKEQSSATARVYVNLGVLSVNDKKLATGWFLKGIHLYERLKDELGMANAYSNYATHLVSLDRKEEGLEYAKKAMLLREKIKDDYGLMYSYANISQIYTLSDSIKQALYYQQKSVQKAEEIGSEKLRAQSYIGLSLIYFKMNEPGLSFDYEMKAVKLLESIGNTEMLSHRYTALAMGYNARGDSAEAIHYFKKSIELAAQHNYKENLRDAYLQTTIFYKDRKDYYQAYEYLKKYYKVRDEILDEEAVAEIAELETKYETQKKEEQIKQLSNEKKIQQLQLEKQGLFRNILIGGIIVAMALAYILFNRYQIKKKLEQKTAMLKERSRISSELHDEVGSTLSTINILSHSARMKLRTDMAKSDNLLEKINENSQRMMDAMSDIVWSINPENDELGNMVVRMKEFASEMLDNRNVDYTFRMTEGLEDIKLSPEIRKDLYLVFKEAVNNLAKYSQATHADITIDKTGDHITLKIADNGKGFDVSLANSGNGMRNMKSRAEVHGGSFEVISREQKGTTVCLSLPIA